MKFLYKTENIFLIVSILFGIFWTVAIPPFQTPDETSHFFRAYGITEGELMCRNVAGSNAGAYLPANMGEFLNTLHSNRIFFNYEVKQNINNLIKSTNIYPSSEKTFMEFVNSCVYNPIPYIPQTIGIFLGKLFDSPLIVNFYLGRLFNFIIFNFLGYYTIKLIPRLKNLVFLLLLMPMTLHQGISLSPDVLTITICFLFVALVLKVKYQVEGISRRQIIYLGLLSFIIGIIKISYFPLVLFSLVIPTKKYDSKAHWIRFSLIYVLIGFLSALLWLALTRSVVMTFPVEPINQIKVILDNPIEFIKLMLFSTPRNNDLFMQFIGTFGWLDTPNLLAIVVCYFVMLFLITFFEGLKIREVNKSDVGSSAISFLAFVSCVLLIQLSLYLNWPQATPGTVSGVQGRYFIPISLTFFYSLYLILPFILKYKKVVLIIFVSGVLVISSLLIVKRYYYFGPGYDMLIPYNNNHIPNGIQEDTQVSQSFKSIDDNLKGISIFISTFGQEVVTPYQLLIYKEYSQEIIRTAILDLKKFQDNQFYDVTFEPINNSKGERYVFTVVPLSDIILTPITLQISEPDIYNEGVLKLNNIERNDDLVFRLLY